MASTTTGGRRRSVLLMIVLTSITLVTLDSRSDDSGPIGAVGRVAHQVVNPVAVASDKVMSPVQDWFGGVVNAGSLGDENEELRREIARLRSLEASNKALLSENEALKGLVGYPYLDSIDSATGRIVQIGGVSNFDNTATLDVGTDQGVLPNMPVVSEGGLVGKVLDSWSNGCTVLLINSASFAVSVRMVSATDVVPGAARGRAGSDFLRVEFTVDTAANPNEPELPPLLVGDIAVTSGLESSEYPPNLPVGVIESVDKGAQGLSISARIRPYVDLGVVQFVKVLLWRPDDQVPRDLADFEPEGAVTTTTTTSSTVPTSVPDDSTTPPSGPSVNPEDNGSTDSTIADGTGTDTSEDTG
jgi:rod shape-determining protein MreC